MAKGSPDLTQRESMVPVTYAAKATAGLMEERDRYQRALENIHRACGFGANRVGMSADGVSAIQQFAYDALKGEGK